MTLPGLERFAAECKAEKGAKKDKHEEWIREAQERVDNLKDEFEREFGHGSISS